MLEAVGKSTGPITNERPRTGALSPITLFNEAKKIMRELIVIQEQMMRDGRTMDGMDFRKNILAPYVLSIEFALPIINEADVEFGRELQQFNAHITNDQVKSKWRYRTSEENATTQKYTFDVMKAVVRTY